MRKPHLCHILYSLPAVSHCEDGKRVNLSEIRGARNANSDGISTENYEAPTEHVQTAF